MLFSTEGALRPPTTYDNHPPSDLCLMDLDRILREGQDPGARSVQYRVRCPSRKTPGVLSAHHVKTSPLDPAPAPAQHGLPVQNGEIFILSKSLGVSTFALRGSPTRLILTNF